MYKFSVNYRLTTEAAELLSQAAHKMGLTKTSAVEQAIRAYATSVLSPRKIREIEKLIEEHEAEIAQAAEQEAFEEAMNEQEEEEHEEA